MSGDLEFIDIENQQNEITILTIKNLFPLRMVGILPYLQQRCDQRLASNPGRMEMEIFTSGSLQSYPGLFAQSGADLIKQAGVQILLGLGLGLVVKGNGRGVLVFNSKDADGFDNPPIELGSSVLNAMARLDFRSVEVIVKANNESLLSITDLARAEASIKAAVDESKAETGNDPANLEYQQLVDCAKVALKSIRGAAA